MAFFDKEYKLDSQDNFDGFLKSAGLPEDKIKQYLENKPTAKVVKNGDSYTYITTGPDGVKETTFKSGVEFEDTIQGMPIKNCYTVEGNTINQVVKTAKGDAYFKREYKGDVLELTITTSAWDGAAKRYYKA